MENLKNNKIDSSNEKNQIDNSNLIIKSKTSYLKDMNLIYIAIAIILALFSTYIFAITFSRKFIAVNRNTDSIMIILFISTLLLAIVMTGILYFLKCNDEDKREIFRNTYGYKGILITLVPFYIGIFVNLIYNFILRLISQDLANTLGRDDFSDMLSFGPLGIKGIIPLFLSLVILAPIYEELIFRGIIFNYLNKKVSVLLSAVISGSIFGLLHGNTFFQTTILGIVLAFLYHYTGSIKYNIIAHAINNFIAFLSMVIMAKTNGNESSPIFLALSLGIMIGFIFAAFEFYRFVKKNPFMNIYYKVTPLFRNRYMELINTTYNINVDDGEVNNSPSED